MPTPLYEKTMKEFKAVGDEVLKDEHRYWHIKVLELPHPTIRSKDKAAKILRRLREHVLMRYGR